MTEKVEITLLINGRRHAVAVEPRRTLVDVIRDDCGLTGTHIGCEHGVCGACTVLLDGEPVRSCLMFAVQAQDKAIASSSGFEHHLTKPAGSASIIELVASMASSKSPHTVS